jgi:hypothetical protein
MCNQGAAAYETDQGEHMAVCDWVKQEDTTARVIGCPPACVPRLRSIIVHTCR